MDLAGRIVQIRNNLGISQEKFGELVNKSQRTVAAWESGTRAPSFATLCLMADTLNVTVDYLLGRTEIPNVYIDTKKDPSPEDQEQAVEIGKAALEAQPLSEAMPRDVAELSALIQQIVDQALDKRTPPTNSQS